MYSGIGNTRINKDKQFLQHFSEPLILYECTCESPRGGYNIQILFYHRLSYYGLPFSIFWDSSASRSTTCLSIYEVSSIVLSTLHVLTHFTYYMYLFFLNTMWKSIFKKQCAKAENAGNRKKVCVCVNAEYKSCALIHLQLIHHVFHLVDHWSVYIAYFKYLWYSLYTMY